MSNGPDGHSDQLEELDAVKAMEDLNIQDKTYCIEDLPLELLDRVFQGLPFEDKLSLRSVSKLLEAAAGIRLKFCPFLDKTTLDECKAFFDKNMNYKEMLVGDLSNTDCTWLENCNLSSIETIRFQKQITQEALVSVRHLIKEMSNLQEMYLEKYNFLHFFMSELVGTGEPDVTAQISRLRIKGHLTTGFESAEDILNNPFEARLFYGKFDCKELSKFTSLQSLDLLTMRGATLKNIATLPISLKHLHVTTDMIPRSELHLLLDCLINLERVVIYCNELDCENKPVQLDEDMFGKVVHKTGIKAFHYYPIRDTTAKNYVTLTSLKGSNVVEMKYTATRDMFIVRLKRKKDFKHE